MYRPPKQDKISRYSRHVMNQPEGIRWTYIMEMAIKHSPLGLRQWLSDNIQLRCTEIEFGIRH